MGVGLGGGAVLGECKRRFEVFVILQKKKFRGRGCRFFFCFVFFFFGGGGGPVHKWGGGKRVESGRGSGWM